jgi:hypothetical protein
MRKIQTQRIRDEYPDLAKQLRVSTKEFLNHSDNQWLEEGHKDFITSCYNDDVNELEKIIFFTSSPFYEFYKVYWYIDEAYKAWVEDYPTIFLDTYHRVKDSGLVKIKFKDGKFYFEGEYVPTNPYNEKLINIEAFELLTEFHKVCNASSGETYRNVLTDFMKTDFIKNHEFQGAGYYCYETDESISGK